MTTPGFSHGFVKGYLREGMYPLEAIHGNLGLELEFEGDMIRCTSDRYTLFARSHVCVNCGVEGVYYTKERSAIKKCGEWTVDPNNGWHFNLYAINEHGHEVLMTKDHIIPKSKGGKNRQSNYQTMCYRCNQKKGNILETA